MGKISNTAQYPTITPASGDYMVATDVSDSNNTKTITVGSMATPMLGSLPSASPAMDDKLIGLDTSDSDNAKKFVVSDILNLTGYVQELFSKNDTDQTLAGTATKTQIVFGAGTIGTNVSINGTTGTVTFNTVGDYFVQAYLSVGNVGGTASVVFMDYEINGTVSNISPTVQVLPASVVVRNNTICFPIKVTSASTTLKFSFGVKTGGNAGMVATATSIVGMTDAPSASISVYKKQ